MNTNTNNMTDIRSFTIFHTNDMHGRLSTHDENESSIGLDKIAKLVNLKLLKNKNTLWFDAGDFTHGTPRMASVSREIITDMLNSTPLNAICTGNHDYNLSMDNLYELSKGLYAHVLSANTVDKETKFPVLLPYVVYNIDLSQDDHVEKVGDSNDSKKENIKLGIFGLSTPETAYKTNPKNVKDIEFENPIETAKKLVKLLRRTCHIVIALTHLGLDRSSEFTSERLAREVQGIDLIIDGHSHDALQNGMMVNNTLIVQAGSHGKYIGECTISMKDKKIVSIDEKLLNQEDVDKIINNVDHFITNKLTSIDELTDKVMSRVVAKTNQSLPGDRELVRCSESMLGNLVADAMRWKTSTDISIVNGGTLRTGLPMGDVTFKDLISIFPFENKVQVASIEGYLIKEMLERSIFSFPAAFGGFMDVSGLQFTFDMNKPVNEKVIEIVINNEKIEMSKAYMISSLDFIFLGGDGFSMLKNLKIIDEFGNIENVVADYLNQFGINDSIKLGRIKILKG